MKKPKKVALAYSGGLDTSIIIPWLKENYGCEVVAVCGDIGQGGEELTGLEAKALTTGASEVHVADMKEEFVRDYVWKIVRAGSVYEEKYLLGTSIARPLLAKKQVEVALATGCDALAHGCTGKGNDQVRFELAYKALAPHLQVIAPWREWSIISREDGIAYARQHNVPIAQSVEKIYSRDRNLWHISHEGGALEDPGNPAPADMWMLTRSPQEAPDEPAQVSIRFEHGVPVSLNGKRATSAAGLVEKLNRVGGEHGIGRVRPGGKPLCGDEVARLLRDPGRDADLCGAPRAGGAGAGQEHAALQAEAGAGLRRTGLQRAVVYALKGSSGRVLRRS